MEREQWGKLSDKRLIERIRQGEKGAWEVLAERYYEEVFRYCWYRTGNEPAAADCTQETFLHMIQGLAGYADENKFRAWVFRIASNVCVDYFRKNKAVCVEDEVLAAKGAEDRALAQAEDACYVEKALLRLTPAQREVVVLKFYHGFKIREIASLLNITLPAAKARLKQGMDRLKEAAKMQEDGKAADRKEDRKEWRDVKMQQKGRT